MIKTKSRIIAVVFSILTSIPVVAAEKISADEYASRCASLENSYQDGVVTAAFNKAKNNTSEFLNQLWSDYFATEGGPEWFGRYRSAIKMAQMGHWNNAESELEKALESSPAEQRGHLNIDGKLPVDGPKKRADLLILSAVASAKTSEYQRSLRDLERLFKLHKEDPVSWNKESLIFGNANQTH